jgi:hypothetical protein
VLAFAWLWLTPLVQFWGAALGPLRPHGYPTGDFAPSLGHFVAGLAACFLPLALPARYYASWEGPRGRRALEALGVRQFKRIATNGDVVNRFGRREDSGYRRVRDTASAGAWAREARGAERNHLVFLLMGLLTAAHAWRIGWLGWAAGLTASNVIFNAYPILLQRYNRIRASRVCPEWARPPR